MIELHCSDTGFGRLDSLIFLPMLFCNTLLIFRYLGSVFETTTAMSRFSMLSVNSNNWLLPYPSFWGKEAGNCLHWHLLITWVTCLHGWICPEKNNNKFTKMKYRAAIALRLSLYGRILLKVTAQFAQHWIQTLLQLNLLFRVRIKWGRPKIISGISQTQLLLITM